MEKRSIAGSMPATSSGKRKALRGSSVASRAPRLSGAVLLLFLLFFVFAGQQRFVCVCCSSVRVNLFEVVTCRLVVGTVSDLAGGRKGAGRGAARRTEEAAGVDRPARVGVREGVGVRVEPGGTATGTATKASWVHARTHATR